MHFDFVDLIALLAVVFCAILCFSARRKIMRLTADQAELRSRTPEYDGVPAGTDVNPRPPHSLEYRQMVRNGCELGRLKRRELNPWLWRLALAVFLFLVNLLFVHV